MKLDLHGDVHGKLARFFEARGRAYAQEVNLGPGQDDDPIRQITVGYQLDQDGWVALVFDTRPDAECDGDWQLYLEGTTLKMPHWHQRFLACVERQRALTVVMPGGAEQTIAGGAEAELTATIGRVLSQLLQAGFARGPFKDLPRAADVLLVVEEQGGAWGWRSDQPEDAEANAPEPDSLEAILADPHFVYDDRKRARLHAAGAEAVPLLLAKVDDDDVAHQAIRMLAEIGDDRPQVLAKLRGLVPGPEPLCWHAASALAELGDAEHLLALAREDPRTARTVARGLRSLYDAMLDHPSPPALDFGPLERAMDAGGPLARELKRLTLTELSLGSWRDPPREQLPEAVRALGSPHAVVRRLAASMLGRRLGKSSEILPALAKCLRDENAFVRYTALWSILQWGKAAQKHLEEVQACLDDEDADVAERAEYVLARLR